jgi:hypothetical protein
MTSYIQEMGPLPQAGCGVESAWRALRRRLAAQTGKGGKWGAAGYFASRQAVAN